MQTLAISTSGTLGFGLSRETEVMCGVRKSDNTFERMAYTFGAKDLGWEKEVSCWLPRSWWSRRADGVARDGSLVYRDLATGSCLPPSIPIAAARPLFEHIWCHYE